MQFFVSSSNLIVDQNVKTTFLDVYTLNDVTNDDVVIGSGTFRDELMLKNLLDRGLFPLMITRLLAKLNLKPSYSYQN